MGHRQINDGGTVRLEAVLLHTDDNGAHWTPMQVDSSDPFFSLVRFNDKNHGWLFGSEALYSSEDGGKTWREVLKLEPPKDSE